MVAINAGEFRHAPKEQECFESQCLKAVTTCYERLQNATRFEKLGEI